MHTNDSDNKDDTVHFTGVSCDGDDPIASGDVLSLANTTSIEYVPGNLTGAVTFGGDVVRIKIYVNTAEAGDDGTLVTVGWTRSSIDYLAACMYNNTFSDDTPVSLAVYVSHSPHIA